MPDTTRANYNYQVSANTYYQQYFYFYYWCLIGSRGRQFAVLVVLLVLVLVLLVLVLVLLVRVPVVVHLRAVLTCKTKWQCGCRARPLGGRWSRRSRTFAVAILFLQPIIIRYLTVVADRVQ